MTSIVKLACAAVAAAGIVWSAAASAGVITINFPQDVTPGTLVSHGNASADGFQISPSAEYSLVAPGSGGHGIITSGLGWDSQGPVNPGYLGPMKLSTASLYVGYNGSPFSVMNLTFVSTGLDAAFEVMSSNGGVYKVPHMTGTSDVSFSGAGWTDIDWLIFGYFDAGVPTVGLQSMVIDPVDEPAAIALFAAGLLALFGLRRAGASRFVRSGV